MKLTRKRKPDLVKQVKRAQAAGLHVRSATVTADSVVVTFGEPEAPVDGSVIETPEQLRRLIMKPPRSALPLPRYVRRKPLKSGGLGSFLQPADLGAQGRLPGRQRSSRRRL